MISIILIKDIEAIKQITIILQHSSNYGNTKIYIAECSREIVFQCSVVQCKLWRKIRLQFQYQYQKMIN